MTSQVNATWATEADLPDSADGRAIRPDILTKALLFSSEVLFNITKRRWPGTATDTYRPCCGCLPATCGCGEWASFELPNTPVQAITSIKVDGSIVAASEYDLRDRRSVIAVRQADGTIRSWRRCQDLTQPTTELNTMEVVYTWGAPPPDAGVTACAILAWEFALAWTPAMAGQCRLPRRVTSVTRAGMSVAVIDPLTLFKDGLTGVPEVDVWTGSLRFGDQIGAAAHVIIPGAPRKATR